MKELKFNKKCELNKKFVSKMEPIVLPSMDDA